MVIKSFRGKIEDNGIDTISLHTNDGSIGYKIKKFELFPHAPGATIQESLVKIFSIPQDPTTTNAIVNFADNTLLGSAYLALNASAYYATDMITIFDNMTFNQDIYLTHVDVVGSSGCNYYIELEKIKLDLTENTVATLKDIRNIKS
jgi:hypothetical protein